ncbi:MAG: glycosyltransferase [Nitrospiraceae bacterium]
MNVLTLSYSDTVGGAARAAARLYRALYRWGISIRMRVGYKHLDINRIEAPDSKFARGLALLRPVIGEAVARLQKTANAELRSVAVLPSGLLREINSPAVDLVHLHWVNKEFLSIEDIGAIAKPLLWTAHDMWPFCGTEHYCPEGPDARWRRGYSRDTRRRDSTGLDIEQWVWRRKRRAWQKPFHIVAPSQWLADCFKESLLFRGWSVSVIPNVVNTHQFQPWPKKLSREMLGLPADRPLLLFGAVGGSNDYRKGWDLLSAAIHLLSAERTDLECVVFGQSAPSVPIQLGVPIRWMGQITDELTLALLYSAADLAVIPSRQEAFGLTAAEAAACGCPTVAFNIGGLRDVVEHEKTGLLVNSFDTNALADAIRRLVVDTSFRDELGIAARDRAVSLWSEETICPKYISLYERIVGSPD